MIGSITLIWLGTVALATTLGGIAVSVTRYQQNESSLTGVITFGFALLFWILFSLHSTGYVRTLGDGTTTTVTTPSMMAVGVIGTILAVILLFDGAMRAIRSTQA